MEKKPLGSSVAKIGDLSFMKNFWALALPSLLAPWLLPEVKAEQVIIAASDAGWYSAAGTHNPDNDNYYVGFSRLAQAELRNWFLFNLPTFRSPPVAAYLRLDASSMGSDAGSETWELHEVTTPISTLIAGGGPGLTQIYDDLGDGPVYGTKPITTTEGNNFITVELTQNALVGLSAAAGQSFAIGGRLTTITLSPTNDDYLFGLSGAPDSFVHLITVTGFSNPPVILVQPPARVSALTGSNLRFGLDAFGTEPLSYQWYCNNSPLAGQTAPNLSISNIKLAAGGDYFAVVTNSYGSVTSTVTHVAIISQGEPSLAIQALSNGLARISWTPNTPGFFLQQASVLNEDPNSWSSVPGSHTNGAVITMPSEAKYFRLIKP